MYKRLNNNINNSITKLRNGLDVNESEEDSFSLWTLLFMFLLGDLHKPNQNIKE